MAVSRTGPPFSPHTISLFFILFPFSCVCAWFVWVWAERSCDITRLGAFCLGDCLGLAGMCDHWDNEKLRVVVRRSFGNLGVISVWYCRQMLCLLLRFVISGQPLNSGFRDKRS